jgi:hypothetical protein
MSRVKWPEGRAGGGWTTQSLCHIEFGYSNYNRSQGNRMKNSPVIVGAVH